MGINLTCAQVASLINYYLDGKLNAELSRQVKIHLENCPYCGKKFSELEQILSNYNRKHRKKDDDIAMDKELIANLSAYMDNELNSGENIKVKKITVSNPQARKRLEAMYRFQRLIRSAYEKTKSDTKFDYSKNVMSVIGNNDIYTTTLFTKIAILSFMIAVAIVAGFLYLHT